MSADEASLQTTSDTTAEIACQDNGPGNGHAGEQEGKKESSIDEEVELHQPSYANDDSGPTLHSEQNTEELQNGEELEDNAESDKAGTSDDAVILQEGSSQHCISVDMESIQNMIPSSSSEQTVLNILLSDQGSLTSPIGVNGVSSSVATQTDSNTISILATSDAGIDLKGTNNVTSPVVHRNGGRKGGVVAVKSREIVLGDGDQAIHQDDGAFLAAVGGDLSGQLASASGFEVTAFVADVGHGGHIIISGGTAYQNANGTISTVQDQLQEISSSDGQLISGAEQEQVSTVAGLGQFSASSVQLSSNSDSEGAQGTLHYVLHSDVTGDGEMQYVDAGLAGAKKLYQCTIDGCGKQFSTPYRLKAHGRTHTGDTFQCEEEGCHKTFITPSDLHKHLKTHTGEKPYLCEFEGCGKVYTTSHHLKVHKRSHSGEKPFICEWENCGRSFSTGYGLKSHYRTHTGERPYKCPEHDCMKAFKTSGDLQKHVRTHTGERPFKCPYEGCGRSFTTSNIRKVHLRTHTGEKPYVCEFDSCGRAFASATNYKNHSRIHTGERPYICEVPGCNKRFTEYSSLYKHNVVHTQQKPYTCEICHKNYRQTSTLAMHRRTVHGSTEEAIDETSEDAGCSEEIIDGEHPPEKRHKLDFDEAAQVATALVQGLPVMVSDEAAATALQTQYAELAASQQIGEAGSLPGAIAIPIQVTMNADGTIAGAQGLNITDSNGRLIPVSLSMSLAISSFTMTPLVETSHGLEIGTCDVSQIYQDPQSSLVTAQVLPEELAGQEVIDDESNGEGRIAKDTHDTDVASSQAVIVTSSLPHHLLAASTADPNEGVTTAITEINDVTRLSQSSSMSSADSTSGVLGQEGGNESGSIEVMGSDSAILVAADHEEPDVTDRYLTKSNLSVKS